jgi:predicted transcriptional regulator
LAGPLDLENRRIIFDFVRRFPGAYFREIQKATGLVVGTLAYHLEYLESRGLISSQRQANRKRYFAAEVRHGDRRIIGVLRQAVPRRLVIHLMLHPDTSFQDLLEVARVSKSTLSFHLSKLTDARIIEASKRAREKAYRVADEEEVSRILITYRSSFLDGLVDRFVETWTAIGR